MLYADPGHKAEDIKRLSELMHKDILALSDAACDPVHTHEHVITDHPLRFPLFCK